MLVIYESRVVIEAILYSGMTRDVIFESRAFKRLATGITVMGGDSCHEFESQHHILGGIFFTFNDCKIVLMFEKD